MSSLWLALAVLVWCGAPVAPAPMRQGAKQATLRRVIRHKYRLPAGPVPLLTNSVDVASVMEHMVLPVLEGVSPLVAQGLQDVLTLPQDKDGKPEKLIDAAHHMASWLQHVEDVQHYYYTYTPLLKETLGPAAYRRLLRWLEDLARQVNVSSELVNSVKNPARSLALCMGPLLENFLKAIVDDLPHFAENVCRKLLHQNSRPQADVDELPGLVEYFCRIFPRESSRDSLPSDSSWTVDAAVQGLRAADKVLKSTECLEKVLCMLDAARTWLPYYPVRLALSVGDATGLLDYVMPQRIKVAVKTLAWEVKGEICCSFFACDVTVIFFDDL